MNLAGLTNYVCTKSQLVEADDQAACALFLSKRYELIYNAYLWKDSLAISEVLYDPVNNLDNADGILYLPQQVDRVVGLRTCDQSVKIAGLEHYFRIDYDAFNKWAMYGSPTEFSILPPDWFEVRPSSNFATSNTIAPSSYGPSGPVWIAEYQNLIAGQSYALMITAEYQRAYYYNGDNQVNLNPLPTVGSWLVFSMPSTGPLVIVCPSGYLGSVVLVKLPATTQSTGPGATLTITSDNQADITGSGAVQIKVTWRDKTDRYTVTGGLPLTLTPVDGQGQIEVESVFKPVTTGNLLATVYNSYLGSVFSQQAGLIAPAVLRSPSYQRIRLFPKPSTQKYIWALGKKPFTPLNFASEEPGIRNLDNCLIAYAMGDMLERSRQYGKAQGQYTEATALLSELAKLETIQAANNSRFIPDSGYGDAFFAPSSNRGIWF
ncbi:MAG TPA: hypothetical protein VK731_09505 [Candidatus Cybelea sp.]|jgi:hypothetical protein|nr:hypothetical protein [Candidatus Cybelea sp.]